MGGSVDTIPILNLAIGLLPAIVVLVIIHRWSLQLDTAVWALVRMLVQLFAVGYVLVHIFESDEPGLILAVIVVMLSAASWIALGPVRERTTLSVVSQDVAVDCSGRRTYVGLDYSGCVTARVVVRPAISHPIGWYDFCQFDECSQYFGGAIFLGADWWG